MKANCCLLKHNEEFYILCEKNGQIMGFESQTKAVDYWEIGYQKAYSRGLCGSTGAMLSYINITPSIIYFETQEELIEALFINPPFKMINFNFTSYGILCQKDTSKLWENGKKPELVKII